MAKKEYQIQRSDLNDEQYARVDRLFTFIMQLRRDGKLPRRAA